MPIFELDGPSLVPIRRQSISDGVYESELEALLWDNLEEVTGDNLFRVARQATLPHGGRPDILALDRDGRLTIIEVKRDVDRHQLAQCLEYAGWARTASLDAVASLYHGGSDGFWPDWQDFTATPTPVLVRSEPRLVLVARSFQDRTASAMDFLLENKLPIKVLKVAFYIDDGNRRFLDVEWEKEPESSTVAVSNAAAPEVDARSFLEVTLSDVTDSMPTPCVLVWIRPRKGERHEATLLPSATIRVADGREFRSPSGAAMAVADVVSYDGWYAWRVGEAGPTLGDLRRKLAVAAPPPGDLPDPASHP